MNRVAFSNSPFQAIARRGMNAHTSARYWSTDPQPYFAYVRSAMTITVVNYLMLLGFMVFFAVADTIGVMVSQNYGARDAKRIGAFLVTSGARSPS